MSEEYGWTPIIAVIDGRTGKITGWFVEMTFWGCEAPDWLYPKPGRWGVLDGD